MPLCLIGLGSNEGNRQATLDAAVGELARQPKISILAVSSWHETAPVGGPARQSHFLNGVVRVDTSFEAPALLSCLQRIENRLGRQRTEHWGPRTIDLDLLLYDAMVLDTPSLVLPHPRMAWRRFVLEPAAEVAGAMLHPTIGWTVARLLGHLISAPCYVAITGPIAAGKTQLAERLVTAVSGRLIAERPNWDQLDAFYADPARHAWLTELEFLRQRIGLLEDVAQPPPAVTFVAQPPPAVATDLHSRGRPCYNAWTVSDFWFDQSAAFARAWLSADQLPAFLEQYAHLRQNVTRPRLVVLLDSPAEGLLTRVHERGRACEQRLTVEQLDRIRRAVQEQVGQPDVGPVLRAHGNDQEAIFAEVLAAVQGME
jgi:2-amino-4-hydroxy-6-hydroxymethyldihydropteridine diphosphokinase